MTKLIKPPVPLKKALALIMAAVAPGISTPIPSYISVKIGTTLININIVTLTATVNKTLG